MEDYHDYDHEEGIFFNLPNQIITDIFSRLPVKSIFRCKSVCKTFLKLISDPELVSLHHSRSPTELLLLNHTTNKESSGFSSLNLVEIENEEHYHNLHYVEEKKMNLPKIHPNSNTTLIGSINGLVCIKEFHYHHEDIIHLWNPSTHEFITIETNSKIVHPNTISYGFGFNSRTNQFHIFRIFQEINNNNNNISSSSSSDNYKIVKSECHVYTLGKGSWRSIGHAPFWYNCREHGVFLHDNLHWWVSDINVKKQGDYDGFGSISCLNIEKMRFEAFPSPSEIMGNDNLATLNTYNDQLCVCDNTSDFEIVIWIMKEYGVKGSWYKEAVISKYPIDLIGNYYEVVHVINNKVFKDGEILMLWRDDWIFSYNLKKKNSLLTSFDAKELVGQTMENGLPPCIDVMEYVSTIFSLKNNFKMEMVKIIQ